MIFCNFKVHSSTLDKPNTKAYIKILIHPSLLMGHSNMHSSFHMIVNSIISNIYMFNFNGNPSVYFIIEYINR